MDKTPQIAEEQLVMTIEKAKDTEVSISVFSADISKSEEISRWQLIDQSLHYDFSATEPFFQKSPQLFIRKSHVLSSNGFNKKRNEAFSEITR